MIPRAVTPADQVLAAAIEKIRAAAPEWAVAHAVADQLEVVGERLGALEDDKVSRDDVARGLKRRAWAALGTALTALAAALWFAIGVARDVGEREGAGREREARQLEDRAALQLLKIDHQALERELAAVRGELAGRYPFATVPVMGPRVAPP